MGKQRTPQGQRPGRRMPLRRGPAAVPATEAPSEVLAVAEPQQNENLAVEDVARAETPDAAPAWDEPSSEAVAETVTEPASEEPVEAAGAPSSEPEAVIEPQPAVTEPAALDEPSSREASAGIVSQEPADAAASDGEAAEAAAPEPVRADPLLPAALAVPDAPGRSEARTRRTASQQTTFHFAFAPVRIDVEGIGVVLANYMHNESVAVLSYMRALSATRSPADMIRLNVTEMQRAADASLTCWSDIARRAARGVPLH